MKTFYFCRTQKKIVEDVNLVTDTYFLIDEKCQLSETKSGEIVTVKTKKDASDFAKNMGWFYPVWDRSFKPINKIM
jgi:hypothetical protein